jgi:glycosyltransferase involved in cell wall biosynthesis
MHLAIVGPYPPNITGISQYGYHVSQSLAQSGLFSQLTVLTGKPASTKAVHLTTPIQVRHVWEPNQFNAARGIVHSLQEIKPDLVWFNLGTSIFGRSPLANLSGLLAPAWAGKLGFPTIVTLHELVELADLRGLNAPGGPLAPYGARLLTRVALQADVVCMTMRRYTDWLTVHRPSQAHFHIPIGAYHTPEMLPESKEASLLFFTTLAPFKGLEILLEAFQTLRDDYPQLTLTIAGTQHARFPEYAQRLKNTASQIPGIRWLGEVPEERVRALFQESRLVVLPYKASTGSSSVLYQAATWGRAVIASDLPETYAVVQESGLEINFFQSGNVNSLRAQIKTQLETPALGHTQVAHNFAAIQRNRPEDICHAYLRAFNSALERRSSHQRITIPALETV